MPQLHLPLFPFGATAITPAISFVRTETTICYFQYDMPISSHSIDDRAAFKLTMAQLNIYSGVKQAVLARAFAIPPITIKRSVKCYKTLGIGGFFIPPARRGAVVCSHRQYSHKRKACWMLIPRLAALLHNAILKSIPYAKPSLQASCITI